MKVFMEGFNYKHDVFELVRVFVEEDVEFVEDSSYKDVIEITFDEKNIFVKLFKDYKIVDTEEEKIEKILDYSLKKSKNIKTKKCIYNLLIRNYDVDLPWGILTGIRPMKIVHYLSERGFTKEEIEKVLMDEYRLDKRKVALMFEIKATQDKYIYPLDQKKYSLYIGIPFCPSICSYCSFPSFKLKDYKLVEEYVDSLLYEIREMGRNLKHMRLNTVYIGGGTPTSLKTKDLERIIQEIYKNYDTSYLREFTIEAGRPDTLTKENLDMFKRHNINRISINPQTMNDDTLTRVGRSHDVSHVIEKYYLAKELGFDIINMDMIVGLPGEDLKDIENTLDQIAKLNPENLTIHNLAIKRGSNLTNNDYLEKLNSHLEIEKLENLINTYIKDMNLKPYYMYRQKQAYGNLENIGYTKEGLESIYNISMMEEKETIIGLGLGAVSKIYDIEKDRIIRVPNFKGLREYNSRLDELLSNKLFYLI